ncbi:MAG: hypothetical protein Gaeavirus6_10 [Gaeavirus sp.]|uniref:J domain-containing protein n=1 Tax=Gaeavirus sp. TaxID=2487767 RepID=A0A3G4ZYP0_9VIRU|nr:MAG: hypothetical protein Gaeavirus6_10 [Gaeavirus sp.]
MTELNLYDILEVADDVSAEVIRRSYRALVLRYHPDKNADGANVDKFIQVKLAYDVLGDVDKRKAYDAEKNSFENIFIVHVQIIKNKISSVLHHGLDNFLNFRFLDIELDVDFSIHDAYCNKSKMVQCSRVSRGRFEECIYPIDHKQIYELEGETSFTGSGDFIVNVIINPTCYNDINYDVLNNDLYMQYNTNVDSELIKFRYLDDIEYEFNINDLEKLSTEFGYFYIIDGFGLPFYNTDVITIESSSKHEIRRGKLFIIMLFGEN